MRRCRATAVPPPRTRPGGDPTALLDDSALADLIRAFDARGVLIAAICAGPSLPAAAGVLDEARYTCSLTPEDAGTPLWSRSSPTGLSSPPPGRTIWRSPKKSCGISTAGPNGRH
ncbi:DJ-1/PfpI family protein [Micromonospora sp. NPDC049679]|uniref:DJ-1/PfpI family protein n=1 Tax=Micromonospora sp. NPDC049679 TaxID=3155920 RepID=UPI0033DF142A